MCFPYYMALALSSVFLSIAAPHPEPQGNSTNGLNACRFLPGDRQWPSVEDWNQLNRTVGGRLIRGVPLAQPCYGADRDAQACTRLQQNWVLPEN